MLSACMVPTTKRWLEPVAEEVLWCGGGFLHHWWFIQDLRQLLTRMACNILHRLVIPSGLHHLPFTLPKPFGAKRSAYVETSDSRRFLSKQKMATLKTHFFWSMLTIFIVYIATNNIACITDETYSKYTVNLMEKILFYIYYIAHKCICMYVLFENTFMHFRSKYQGVPSVLSERYFSHSIHVYCVII